MDPQPLLGEAATTELYVACSSNPEAYQGLAGDGVDDRSSAAFWARDSRRDSPSRYGPRSAPAHE